MKLLSLTYERVEQLREQHAKLRDEFEAMKRMAPKDLWVRDLDNFEQVYNQQVSSLHCSSSREIWKTSGKTGRAKSLRLKLTRNQTERLSLKEQPPRKILKIEKRSSGPPSLRREPRSQSWTVQADTATVSKTLSHRANALKEMPAVSTRQPRRRRSRSANVHLRGRHLKTNHSPSPPSSRRPASRYRREERKSRTANSTSARATVHLKNRTDRGNDKQKNPPSQPVWMTATSS